MAPTMAVLVHTWRILMTHCDSLAAVGMDLSFEVHRLLAPSLKIAIETNFANIIESVRLRVSVTACFRSNVWNFFGGLFVNDVLMSKISYVGF